MPSRYALVVKFLPKDPVPDTLITAGAQKNTTSGVLRKDPFLHDFLVIVNILLFVSELVYFDWVLLCGSTKNIFHIVFRRHFVANIFICD